MQHGLVVCIMSPFYFCQLVHPHCDVTCRKTGFLFFFPFLTAGQLHKPRIRQLVDSMIEESDMAQHKNIEIYQEWSSSVAKEAAFCS